jgi:hypothetical protein
VTRREKAVVVRALTVHETKNYAITRLVLIAVRESGVRDIVLSSRVLEATPNHPMPGGKTAGEMRIGDRVLCDDGEYTVWDKTEGAGGMQRVYNIVAGGGSTLVLNGVVVKQK